MKASEIYNLACQCYNGDEAARREWFGLLAPLARAAALPYGVLPGIVLARAARESGWGSDLYELTMEKRFGFKFVRKAQTYNNMLGMVAYGKNDEYMPGVLVPEWADYKDTFMDYGPHGDMSGNYGVTLESWKAYDSIEDAFEDFSAVIRSQAYRRGEAWPADLRGQLLSMGRGYTPEGGKSARGMDFAWQDTTLDMYDKYNLAQYDAKGKEAEMATPVKMTLANMEAHIVRAYKYAYANCHYGRTDTHYPPGEPTTDGKRVLDCVGLIYRALWTMGRLAKMLNIDQLQDLCIANGLKKSTDINDAWRRHGIVCFQDRNNAGTQHINHVFYTLGGTSIDNISKYDLGSDPRMRSVQPFQGVPVNEWPGIKCFLCMFYIDEKVFPEPVQDYEARTYARGVINTSVGMYEGPGTEYRKIRKLSPGEAVVYGLRTTNHKGQDWRRIDTGKEKGWIYYSSVSPAGSFKKYKAHVKDVLDDGFAAVRVGAGVGCPESFRLDSGAAVTVDGTAKDKGGAEWLHIVHGTKKKRRGWVAAGLLVKN